MTSAKTAAQIITIMIDWCHGDPNTMNDLLTLLGRLREIKGSKSFTDSMQAVYSQLKDAISETKEREVQKNLNSGIPFVEWREAPNG